MAQIIFVTGTDTGVGRTLLTALLLRHQRQCRVHALGLKPIASGSRDDALILADAQDREIGLGEINPSRFSAPMAPALAARRSQLAVPFHDLTRHIRRAAEHCELLLVEGAGGLLVPLGEKYTVLDLICALECPVVIVAPNKLGVVNHVLLTIHALSGSNVPGVKVVLMNGRSQDRVTKRPILLSSPNGVEVCGCFRFPFFGLRSPADAVT